MFVTTHFSEDSPFENIQHPLSPLQRGQRRQKDFVGKEEMTLDRGRMSSGHKPGGNAATPEGKRGRACSANPLAEGASSSSASCCSATVRDRPATETDGQTVNLNAKWKTRAEEAFLGHRFARKKKKILHVNDVKSKQLFFHVRQGTPDNQFLEK